MRDKAKMLKLRKITTHVSVEKLSVIRDILTASSL